MSIKKMTSVAYDVGISGVGEHNTISSGPDGGANNNLACAFWKEMRHSTNEVAINNFLGRLGLKGDDVASLQGSGALNLGGHGNEGFLTTGCGQNGNQDYETNYITAWNEDEWGPIFSKLKTKNFPFLKIWSCHTGAGSGGANLLYAIALRIGKPVLANTGFLYSNSNCRVWQENGSVWQVATPSHKPKPISAPTPHFLPGMDMNDTITIADIGIDIKEISEISFEFRSHALEVKSHKLESKKQISVLAKEVASTQQFELPGLPAAFLTAKLFVVGGKTDPKLTLNIYNDRLVTDINHTIGFYVGPVLQSMIKTFKGII